MHPKALLDAAEALLRRVLAFEEPADRVVFTFMRGHPSLGARDRRTLTDTVYAVLRHLPTWRWRAAGGPGAVERSLAVLAWQGRDDALDVVLTNAEQAWRTRALAADPQDRDDAPRHDWPVWLVERITAQIGEAEARAWCAAVACPAPLDLRVNIAKATRDEARARLAAETGIEAADTPYSPFGLRVQDRIDLQRTEALRTGLIEVQDEGSQLLALALGARRGETVADYCAGGGGKTLAIGAQMRGKGRLYAFDTSAARLAAMPERLARAGLDHVVTMQTQGEGDVRLQRLHGKIDRVLVDAPCSGLGTLRRHPDLAWRQTSAAVQAFAPLQRDILAAASRLVKPGGRLVYATCSPLVEENEAIAAGFDAAQGGAYTRLDLGATLAKAQAGSAAALAGAGDLRLWTHRHGTDGFYAAAWQRNTAAKNDSSAV